MLVEMEGLLDRVARRKQLRGRDSRVHQLVEIGREDVLDDRMRRRIGADGRMLDGIELPWRDLAQSGQSQIQRLAIWRDALDECSEVFAIDPLGLRVVGKLLLNVLPRKRVELDLVESLQRQAARQTSGSMGRGPRHSIVQAAQ